MNVGNVLGFLGRGREPDLGSAGEIIENLFPGRIVGGAATVTLIDDNEIEKARREFPEKFLALLRPRDGLVQAQINFIGGVDAALFVERRGEFDLGAVCALDSFRAGTELGHCRAEWPKIIDHRLIDKDVAVGEEQDAFLAPGFP